MNKVYQKRFSFFLAIIFYALSSFAQQNHFVYIQTENKQPFYIKLDKRILSSSASGYLIIPKIQDGNYILTIGFPKNEWPEQNVTCSVDKKDAGYLLKNFGDKGWGLFNLQTMEVILPVTKPVDNKTAAGDNNNDLFSNTLSGVVDDPSIIKRTEEKLAIKEVIKPAEPDLKKVDSESIVVNVPDQTSVIKKAEDKPVIREEEIPVIEIPKNKVGVASSTQIKKLFSVESTEGTDMVYADIMEGQTDTIRLFVPVEKKEQVVQPAKKAEAPVAEVPEKEEPKKIEIKEDVKKEAVSQPEKKVEIPVVESPQKEDPQKTQIKQEAKKEVTTQPEKKTELPLIENAQKEEPQKTVIKKEEAKNNSTKFINIELPNPNAKKDTVIKPVATIPAGEQKSDRVVIASEKPKEAISKPSMANSDCKNFASDEDFLKLRKKMAAGESDDKMIDMAKKVFKSRCFTTEQVKNLCVLFLKDEGKYRFLDLAYPFVSDSYNFGTLEAQLSDNYFISRFKAMIHH